MKEKRKKEKHRKSHKGDKKRATRKTKTSDSSSTSSDEWVEKESLPTPTPQREDWMAMTGILKTYTKDDIHTKRQDKEKKHIDSYNPSTSSRELNPYWKQGGSGLPQTAESFRKSMQFLKPSDDDDYYSRSSDRKSCNLKSRQLSSPPNDKDDNYKISHDRTSYKRESRPNQLEKYSVLEDCYTNQSGDRKSSKEDKSRNFLKPSDHKEHKNSRSFLMKKHNDDFHKKSYDDRKSNNWRRSETSSEQRSADSNSSHAQHDTEEATVSHKEPTKETQLSSQYLSDEKMNKLAAKILKAEIMGDTNLIAELKEKLEAAREYRKQNPGDKPDQEDDGVMLITTNSSGNSRPLAKTSQGDARSKAGKRKADTHLSGERAKYFGNDDKYNLAEMFQNEKYGNNYNDEAELARIASKSKNPNDDMEDIFMDEISKNRNEAKDNEAEKNRAIKQHVKMEKSIEGCEYCIDSKNMLKHLIVSCGSKVYVAVPSRKSLVKNHCIISTIQHSTCVTALDEDVWEEIMDYRKALTQFFNSQNKDVVFFETATRLHRFPHLVISCIPLPRDVGDMAAIYFKKALLECEAEWSMNKKVVELKGKNIRKGVPKGLPYFWIDFGMDAGFAHVIEDQQLFPKTFAEEVIAGILDLDHSHWKNPKKEFGDAQRKKVLDFLKDWKPFDPVKKKD